MGKSLWNGVFTLNIDTVPKLLHYGLDLFGKRVPKNQILLICYDPAHVMDHQSGFQGYKTFPLGLLMAGIQFHMSILCGS